MNNKLTIIICTLNEESNLKNILENLNKNNNNFKIIIIDGDSKDNTKEVAEKYKNVKFINTGKIGLLFSRIYAINIIETEYFAFIDADDLIESNDILLAYNYLINNNLDGIQFKTTSRILKNNYWQKVWAAYFRTIYISNRKISMLGRPCISKTCFYKDLKLENKFMEDTYLNKVILEKYGKLKYEVVPYFSFRLCENNIKANWKKWYLYGKGDAQITTSLSSLKNTLYHLFITIFLFRTVKTLFSKDFIFTPGILFFSSARIAGFITNIIKIKYD
jgi:glycosyltransferase involved in cell wall biosynthesis